MEENFEEAVKEQVELVKNLKLLEGIAKAKMTKEAIARYGNLKLAHPELAVKAIALIAQAAQLGQVDEINDTKFKELLQQIQEKKELRFKR